MNNWIECGPLTREESADKNFTDIEGCAVVTGGSRGIGAAIALALGRAGYDVIVNYKDSKESAEDIVARIRTMGRKAETCQADVSNFEECNKLFEFTLETFGNIDVWVNNAGMKGRMPYLEARLNLWKSFIKRTLCPLYIVIGLLFDIWLKTSGHVIYLFHRWTSGVSQF